MDITPYVENLRQDLSAAAEAGGPEAREAAERLALALDPAVRLVLMEALSQAAAEITSELPAGSVDVRLRGREPRFVVDVPTMAMQPRASADRPASPEPPEADEDDGSVARITLRLPESVKYKAEELATRRGHSLNSWIVNVVRAATKDSGAVTVDVDLSSIPFLDGQPFGSRRSGNRRMTGWV